MRIIGHLDMDAFFAAIEERDNPHYRGLPIVIGADPKGGKGRGVVSTANYKAREYGIHSALPISIAWRLSQKAKAKGLPEAIFFEPDMKKFARNSRQVMEIIRQHSFLVEPASVDEAYFELTNLKNFKNAIIEAKKIKKQIKEEMKMTCTIGIGPNKLVAKMAAASKKPDGLVVIPPNKVQKFLDPLPSEKIPGIGPKTALELEKMGIKTIEDLRTKISREKLEEDFGKWGSAMYAKARGIDETPLQEDHEAKSVGEQETFEQDTKNFDLVYKKMASLCDSVIVNMKKEGFKKFQNAVLTVRFADFETKDRAVTLKEPSDDPDILKNELTKLLLRFFDKRENPRKKAIRLVGVRLKKFI